MPSPLCGFFDAHSSVQKTKMKNYPQDIDIISKSHLQQGVTLIEMLIVIAIVALGAGITVVSLTQPGQRSKPEIVSYIEAQRAQAIKSGRRIVVMTKEENGQSVITGRHTDAAAFPVEKRFVLKLNDPLPSPFLEDQQIVEFFPDGTATFAHFTLQLREPPYLDFMRIKTNPFTGEVVFERL